MTSLAPAKQLKAYLSACVGMTGCKAGAQVCHDEGYILPVVSFVVNITSRKQPMRSLKSPDSAFAKTAVVVVEHSQWQAYWCAGTSGCVVARQGSSSI